MEEKQEQFRVIIAGGRDFTDYEMLRDTCDRLFVNKKPTEIISGEALGADTWGKVYATERGIPVVSMPACWSLNGKRAGMIRNVQMAQNADALVAFWDGKSHGTKHMIETARRYKLDVRVIPYIGRKMATWTTTR